MTPEQALRIIEQERLDVLAEGSTEAECNEIASYVLASAYRKLAVRTEGKPIYPGLWDDAQLGQECEMLIALKTHFTGNPPYVGNEGVLLALREALDELNRLKALPSPLAPQAKTEPSIVVECQCGAAYYDSKACRYPDCSCERHPMNKQP